MSNNDTRNLSAGSAVAAVGGFIEGLSYLNKDRRLNFGTAFEISATSDAEICMQLRSIFSQLPDLTLSIDESFQGGFRQLEVDIGSHLLVEPHIDDANHALKLRKYLSWKILDKIFCNVAEMKDFGEPRRILGSTGDRNSQLAFYFLSTGQLSFVIYFHRGCAQSG